MCATVAAGARGLGAGAAIRTLDMLSDAGELAWFLSSRALRRVERACQSRRHTPRQPRPGEKSGAGLERLLLRWDCAPATARRYRQIADRFTAWSEGLPGGKREELSASRYLAEAMTGPGFGRDPRHLGLRRTTLCALRSALDRPFGLSLTAGIPIPPRPPPVPATAPDTVTALRRAARGEREKLLLILSSDLGLRPGEMVAVRRGDLDTRGRRVRIVLAKRVIEATVPAASIEALRAARCGGDPMEYLFAASGCERTAPLTVRTLQSTLRRLCGRTGTASDVTLTSLRKTCAIAISSKAPPVDTHDSAGPAATADKRAGGTVGPSPRHRVAAFPPFRHAEGSSCAQRRPPSARPCEPRGYPVPSRPTGYRGSGGQRPLTDHAPCKGGRARVRAASGRRSAHSG